MVELNPNIVEACCAIIIMVDVGSGYKLLIYVHPSV
jgi:hypothetical protein